MTWKCCCFLSVFFCSRVFFSDLVIVGLILVHSMFSVDNNSHILNVQLNSLTLPHSVSSHPSLPFLINGMYIYMAAAIAPTIPLYMQY